jgi:hypothetical protein
MHDLIALLRGYRNRINLGIAIRAIVHSALLFGCGLHLYFVLWLILGAHSPALLYANIAIRAALALVIIYVIWKGFRDLWDYHKLSRYLDNAHGAGDDLFQNALELSDKDPKSQISKALVSESIKRIGESSYPIPKAFSRFKIIIILLVAIALISFWYFFRVDFGAAFRQFYSNRAPIIVYNEEVLLSPGNISIGKNQELTIRVEDPDPRLDYRLFYRIGENWRELGLKDNSYSFSRLENSIEYYAENSFSQSPIYRIEVLDEPIVRRWEIGYQYPSYTRLEAFTDSMSYGNIEAYSGTSVTLRIQSNVALESAAMVFSDASRRELSRIEDTDFVTQFTVTEPGQWHMSLIDELGRGSRPEPKQIRILPDEAPQIRLLFPGEDVTLNQNLILPLIISADDDFGLANASLHYQINQRESESIEIQSIITNRIFNTDYLWDMQSLDLFPGDVVTYWAEIYDNAPIPQKGQSSRFRARFPSIEEIYAEIESQEDQRKEDLAENLDKSRKLQEEFEQKRRELLKNPELEWEDQKHLEDMLQQQEDLAQDVENIAQNYQELISKMQANSTLSRETLEKMMKIQELMQEIANDDLFDALRQMEDAMQNVNAEELRKAMENFQFSMEDFAKKIEQTLALLESIKNEQAMQKALQISQEIEKMQNALSQKTPEAENDHLKLADEQGQIQDKYKNLEEELYALKDQLEGNPDVKRSLEELLDEMQKNAADQDMQRSQKALEGNDRSSSSQAQQEAMQKLRNFTLKLGEMKESMSSGSQSDVMNAVERAIRELLIFSKKHEETKARYEADPYPILPDLIASYEGVQLSLNKLFSKPQVSMILPPKFYQDTSDTQRHYREIFSILGQARPPRIDRDLQGIQRGLNLMAYDLMMAMQNSSSGGGGGGGMESLMQMLEQMGQEQMAMNMLTEQLMMQMQSQGGRMDAAMQDQVQKLATDQERLAENLKRALQNDPEAQKQGNALRQIIEEAEAVARNLRQNRFSPELMKQQENILSRLLDAQRSITKRDTSERRRAQTGSGLPSDAPSTGLDYDSLRRAMIHDEGFKNYPREYQQLIMEYLKLLQEGE